MMNKLLTILLTISVMVSNCQNLNKQKTEEMSFTHDGLQYSGFIDLPEGNPKAIILLIPGSGKTDFSGNTGFAKFFRKQRNEFLSLGFAVCAWDKYGCGKSEGEFKEDLPIEKSVSVVLKAMRTLKEKKIPGSKKIGLWGISRGGWVCPLVIEKEPNIAFWISISGADKFDNFRYLLESNFKIEGRTNSQIDTLLNEFDFRMKSLRNGDIDFDAFISDTKHLYKDSFYQRLGEKAPSKEEYQYLIDYFKTSNEVFDEGSGLRILVPEFEKVLRKVRCPVLAILGEKDSQIDWQSTKRLYEGTIPENLKLVTIPNCNHLMMKCRTGGMFENLEEFGYEICDEYYESMLNWLKELEI